MGSPKLQQGGKDSSALEHRKIVSVNQGKERKLKMGGEIIRKCPYLEEDCPAMSRNRVEPAYGEIRRNQVQGMLKEIDIITSF